jgi:ribosomal-protein-alanine N-acetyltransferase
MMEDNCIYIRPMKVSDLDAVLHIDRLSFSMPWPESAYRYELNKNQGSMQWVAERISPNKDDQVIGMIVVWLIMDEAHIATLAVHPDFREKGVGSRLLEFALNEAFHRGASNARLEVRAGNHIARFLYENFGFEVIHRRPRYYRDNNEDALLMNLEDLERFLKRNQGKWVISHQTKI